MLHLPLLVAWPDHVTTISNQATEELRYALSHVNLDYLVTCCPHVLLYPFISYL